MGWCVENGWNSGVQTGKFRDKYKVIHLIQCHPERAGREGTGALQGLGPRVRVLGVQIEIQKEGIGIGGEPGGRKCWAIIVMRVLDSR